MKDFSSFIHEEIFLIDTQKTAHNEKAKEELDHKVSTPITSNYKIGIIAQGAQEEEKQLLDKILAAISIDSRTVLFSDKIDEGITTWIVFSESFDFIEKGLQHFTISDVNGALIITSKPLKVLRDSVDDKGELWSLLKGHFNS